MEDNPFGILRILVKRGINLAVRDAKSSDPYVVITTGHQKFRTHVIYRNCNPVWNELMAISVKSLDDPVHLTVYDKDTFTVDDKMGEADIDFNPYLDALKMSLDLHKLPNGCAIKRVRPNRNNCLAEESSIVFKNGKITQDMILRLKNVECGEVEITLDWVDPPGCATLGREGEYWIIAFTA